MRLSDKTVKKAVDELKDFGLIEEEHMGLNKANRIYLTSVNVENTGIGETPTPESEDLRLRNRKIYDSGIGIITIQETEILRTNDTEFNNTDVNDIQSILQIYLKVIFQNYSLGGCCINAFTSGIFTIVKSSCSKSAGSMFSQFKYFSTRAPF